MTDQELLEAARRGFIPYEGEEAESFRERIAYSESVKETLGREMGDRLPAPPGIFNEALSRAAQFYGAAPDWVPVVLSSEKLLPWQGGCALIFQMCEGSPLSAMIQLRDKIPSFFVNAKELIVHEFAHIARMGFEEKKFEEIIAYRSAENKFYRTFGPLFRTGFESTLFTAVLILVAAIDIALLMTGSFYAYETFAPLKLIPAAFLVFLFFRLMKYQSVFDKTAQKVGLPAVLCLTDHEIELFSKMNRDEIIKYLDSPPHSLRHRLVRLRTVF